MKSIVFILRILETLLIATKIDLAVPVKVSSDNSDFHLTPLLMAYAISLIANGVQRFRGSVSLVIISTGLIAFGCAQELGYLKLIWDMSYLFQTDTLNIIFYPAILLIVIDWLSFMTIQEKSANTRAISSEERIAMMSKD